MSWSPDRCAAIRGHTQGRPRRLFRNSSSLHTRVGEDVLCMFLMATNFGRGDVPLRL